MKKKKKKKSNRTMIKEILGEKCKISKIDNMMQKSEGEKIDSWPSLIHKSINEPTMFFIIYIPSNKEDRKLFIVSKEEWTARFTMLAGKSRNYLNISNWYRTLIYEKLIELENGDRIIFATRKNWYKIIINFLVFATFITLGVSKIFNLF